MAANPDTKNGGEVAQYVPPRKQRRRGPSKMQPPLTPMIDVTFQLLIYFVLTMAFRQAEGVLPGNLPQGDTSDAQPMQPDAALRIVITPSGDRNERAKFELSDSNFRMDSGEQLFQALEARKASMGAVAAKEMSVVIQPSLSVQWDWVVEAYNQAVRAKFEKISFAAD